MVIYDSAFLYIESASSLVERVAKIDAIIIALEDVALKAASSDNIDEYWLDDGQTRIKTIYKGADEVYKSIHAFDSLKQRYVNRLNGRKFKLMDGKSIYRGRGIS